MALRKEPERRYQSVEQFSEDIRRHLEALPVVARKDTLAYRSAKFVRRNAVTTAAAAFVFLTLLGGIIATTSQAHRAKAEKARAERRFNDVRQLARSVLFDYHDAIKDLPGATRVRERLVKDALTYLDSLASEAAGDPALQRELAAAYQRVGDVRGQAFSASLGDRAGAMESYLKSLRIHEALVAATPRDAQNRRDLADIHRKIGNALLETSEAARGLEYLRTSLEIYSKLAVERSANPDARADLADIYNDIGSALEDRGDMAGTLEHHRKAMPLREALVASQPSNAKARRDLSVTYVNTGRALYFNGDTAGAMEINRKALDLRTALNSEDPTNADYRRLLAIAYQNDGDYRAHSGDIAGALESFRKKIVLDRESLATDPANAQARLDFAYSSERMGVLLSQLGQNSEAVSHFRDNLSSQEKTVAADPQNLSARYKLVLARAEVAETEAKLGKRDFALAGCREAVALLNEASDDPTNAYIRGLRGRIYSYLGSAYAALANAHLTTAGERRDDWRNARVMYERSLTVWNDLRSRALLLADDATKPEELSREIAKCDAALGR
jgi:tetratricopeptide (TPR) repeat protein